MRPVAGAPDREYRFKVGGHDDFDAIGRFETVQLVEQLHHRALHLVFAALTICTCATDAIDFIHEDQTRLVLTR